MTSRSMSSTRDASVWPPRKTSWGRRAAPVAAAVWPDVRSADRCSGPTTPPAGAMATARWTSLRSCRTLPGQQYCENRSSTCELSCTSGLPSRSRRFAQEKRAQVGNLLGALAKRRHVDADHAQPVVQVLAKLALGDALFQVGVGRGDDAHVHSQRSRLADRQDLPLLEKAQQLGLHVERKVADFVEEQRPARRRPHAARADPTPRR